MENLIICLILIISVLTDLRNRKILNIVTFPAILGGLIYFTLFLGFDGFLFSGKGFLVGLGLLFIPFAMGGIGAGDVKLLAAIGSWKGAMFVFYTGIYAAIIGGVIAFVILIKQRKLGFTFKSMLFSLMFFRGTQGSLEINPGNQGTVSIPYAIPIAIGGLLTYIVEYYI
ncbi:A24 family peptidase [Fredinandcohnia onubensis]|uniref:A24 family peptidase n=1 Tax=Fredinandcohnia onubensis TaxID=1571209 RepID=UPI000C0BC81A|nr:prepilin peptidase [Fredinandcohnia onubensis]